MKELIEIRGILKEYLENADTWQRVYKKRGDAINAKYYLGEEIAFSSVIEMIDNRLNNSVVKPSERRSATETFNGCNPPDERQNPSDDLICLNCKKEMGTLESLCMNSQCFECYIKDKLKRRIK